MRGKRTSACAAHRVPEANTGCTERLFWQVPQVQLGIPLQTKQAGLARKRIAVEPHGDGYTALKAHGLRRGSRHM
jgi:hypothetical protein